MPNGYTAPIYDGTDLTLRGYLIRVGRSMGFSIEQRDESLDAPPRRLQYDPDNYHARNVRNALDTLKSLATMTEEEARESAQAEFEERRQSALESIQRYRDLQARYDTLIAQVGSWEVPSELATMKEVALRYLHESRDFDASDRLIEMSQERLPEQPQDPQVWLNEKRESALRNLERGAEGVTKEVKRVQEQNYYLDLLHDALPEA